MKKLKFIDLFCGAGGLSHSFKKRGHLLKLALDIDPISIKTLKKNFPKEEKNIINSDIRNLFLNKSLYNLNKNIDVLMGGPPCQGFSTANRQNIINDPRNNLYKYFIKFAKLIEPKFILIEKDFKRFTK